MMSSQPVTSNASVPPARRWRSLAEIRTVTDGPPLSLGELSQIAGFSTQKLRVDIDGGYLLASRALYGERPPYRVSVADARAYLQALGLL